MKSGLYIETECKSLRALNAEMKRSGSSSHYEYIGFYRSAAGYKQRHYQLYLSTGQSFGDPVVIYFNS